VRGIYSTALTKILLDKGFLPGDLSEKILKRLSIEGSLGRSHVDVTLKNDENFKDVIVVTGFQNAVRKTYSVLKDILKRSFFSKILPLYAVFRGRVEKKISRDICLVETPIGASGLWRDQFCFPGQETNFTIIGYENDLKTPVLREGVYIVGKYMILNDSGVAQYSEHIKDPDVIEELRGLSEIIVKEGFGVKWRSSAKNIDTTSLLNEYTELKDKYREVKERLDRERGLAYIGEEILFIHVSSEDMKTLDIYRSSVIRTFPGHHVMKTYSTIGELIDLLDEMSDLKDQKEFMRRLSNILRQKMYETDATLIHRKTFFEKIIYIGPARILNIFTSDEDDVNINLLLHRVIKGEGVYDGLNIPKNMGDHALTFVSTSLRSILHAYFSEDGELKGLYINMNTKPVVIPDIDHQRSKLRFKIIYNDLFIDGVIIGDEIRIIDDKEFNYFCEEKIFSEELCQEIRDILNNMMTKKDLLKNMFIDLFREYKDQKIVSEDSLSKLYYVLTH